LVGNFIQSRFLSSHCAGLGSLGVGWYSLVFAWSGNRTFFLATVPIRLTFAGLILSQWGWSGVVGYEASVAVVAAVAAYA